MYKNAFIDLDGTMLNEWGKITPQTYSALENLSKADVGITITTGRWPISSFVLNEKIEKYNQVKNKYLISLNGSLTYDLSSKEIISSIRIDERLFDKLLEIAKKFKMVLLVYTESGIKVNESYGYKMPFKWAFRFYNGGRIIKLNPKTFQNKSDILKVLFISVNTKKLEKLYVWFKENMSDYLQFVKVSSQAIEITSLDSTKGNAIKTLCKKIGIKPEECVCFGDSENDVSMFKTVGTGFAVNPKSLKTINLSSKTLYGKRAFVNAINNTLNQKKHIVINIDDFDYDLESDKLLNICKEYNDFDFLFYTEKHINDILNSKFFKKVDFLEDFAIIVGDDFIIDQNQQILFAKFIDNNIIKKLSRILKKNKIKYVNSWQYNKANSVLKELKIKKIRSDLLKPHVSIAYYELEFNTDLDESNFICPDYNINREGSKIIITSNETSSLIDSINNKETLVFSKKKINLLDKSNYQK